jgi:L-histidine Nalpha-methyltransferase
VTPASTPASASAPESSGVPAAVRQIEDTARRAVWQLLTATGALGPQPASAEQAAGTLGAAARHRWLVRRWLERLAADGYAARSGSGYRAGTAPADPGPQALAQGYAALRFPAAMAAAHATALARLHELVRGDLTVQRLLFADGDVLGALRAYQDNAVAARLNTEAAALLARARGAESAPFRLLELGGGAGLGTAAALAALPDSGLDYLFTDISRLFIVEAAARFRSRPALRCALVDLNGDIAGQVAAASPDRGQFDAVLAGNVLHNAASIPATLAGLRAVLRPGGSLVFTEAVDDSLALLTLMQFLLSAGDDGPAAGSGDRRAGTGRLFPDAATWRADLAHAGFSLAEVFPADNCPLAAMGQRLFHAVAA